MATAPRLGLEMCKTLNGVNNGNLTEYALANSYGTALGVGDPLALTTDGSVIQASNSANTIGVFHGVTYVDSTGRIQIQKYWPASTNSLVTPVTVLVSDNPLQTYLAVCDSPIPNPPVIIGNLYPMILTAPDSNTGRSKMKVNNTPVVTGTIDAHATTNVCALTNIENGDVFTAKSSVANVTTTITLITNMTAAQLLAAFNVAGNGLLASYQVSTGYLSVKTTDGGDLVLTDSTGTPLADSSGFLGTSATHASKVSAGSDMVKIIKVIDATNNVVEVILSEHSLVGRGAN